MNLRAGHITTAHAALHWSALTTNPCTEWIPSFWPMSAQSRTVRALRDIPAAAKSSPTLAIAGPAHARTTGTSQHVASRLSGRHDDAGNALSAMAGSAAEQGSLAAGVCEFVHARVYVRFSVGPANDSLHANLGDWSQNDAARPDALHALVEAEDDLIAAHRQHIEASMACEDTKLGQLCAWRRTRQPGLPHWWSSASRASLLQQWRSGTCGLPCAVAPFTTSRRSRPNCCSEQRKATKQRIAVA